MNGGEKTDNTARGLKPRTLGWYLAHAPTDADPDEVFQAFQNNDDPEEVWDQ